MNKHTWLGKLQQTTVTAEQQQRLFKTIGAILKRLIDDRSPRKRPAGKAGFRAEKGYYRLLYLEGDFNEKATFHEPADQDAPADRWACLIEILRQLTDLPELRAEILTGMTSAVDEIISQAPTDGST